MTTDIRAVLAAEPTYEELYDLADECNGDVVPSMRAALARWGRPATPVALPPNYIDPEHQGADRQLLEIFYLACNAESGTADEIDLRGIKAVLAARPAVPVVPVEGEVGEGSTMAEDALIALERIQHGDVSHGSEDFDFIANALGQLRRAATLLEQLSAPAPVVVPVAVDADVQYEFSVLDGDDCEQAGGSAPTLDDVIREGRHYLGQYNQEWDPHRLELRRVEIIPLPQAGEGEG